MNKLPSVRVGHLDSDGLFIEVNGSSASFRMYYNDCRTRGDKTLYYVCIKAICDRSVQANGVSYPVVFDNREDEISYSLLWTAERYAGATTKRYSYMLDILQMVVEEFPLQTILKSSPRLWEGASGHPHPADGLGNCSSRDEQCGRS
jgi:hypothetical protein